MVNSSDRSFKRTLDLGATPKPLKRLRFDVDGQDEADGRLVIDGVFKINTRSVHTHRHTYYTSFPRSLLFRGKWS